MAASLRDGIAPPASSRSRRLARVAALAATMIVSACACQPAPGDGTGAAASPEENSAAAEPAEDGPTMGPPVVASASVPPALLTAALEDAAKRTGANLADIEVTVAEPVTWPDGSMGCPQPGMMYTQALVPGYRIVLQAGGQELNYHAGARGGGPSFCPADRVAPPAPGGREEAM